MVSFKSTFIAPITLILVCGSVIAVDSNDKHDESTNTSNVGLGVTNDKLVNVTSGSPITSGVVNQAISTGINYNDSVSNNDFNAILGEIKRVCNSIYHNFNRLYRMYVERLKLDKKNDGHCDYIKEKNCKIAKLSSEFGEIMTGFKLDKRHKMIDNLDKLSNNLIAYKEFMDEVYNKTYSILKGDESENYEYELKKHNSILLFIVVDSWESIMNILNETYSDDDNKFSMKTFDEHKLNATNMKLVIHKKDVNYKSNINDMKEEVSRATKEFNRCIDSTVDNIGEYGIYIDSGIISSIKTLADTIANISYTLIPGLMTISITSLIYLIF